MSLSEPALALFRDHIARHGNIRVDDSNRETFRELARAGLMRAANSFTHGSEAVYRVTKLGFERRAELLGGLKEAV
ncbi:MAG: hypothetical protein ABS79_03445 [Planctomycetes bacterium SCN 63-9]|nr:MAG: hypothetical protein ABS79_03445 [Planctomycetes bacterium SCN 63-9]